MSAATITAGSAGSSHAGVLELSRDDGVLAALLGHGLGRRVGAPPIALLVVALLPGLAAYAATGPDAPRGVVVAAVAFAVLAGGLSSGRPHSDPLRWTVPPALRAIEYGGLLWVAAVAGAGSQPAVFALGCALAYHHYDLVYGQRHRGTPPPRWLQAVAGGWDGRLLLGGVLLLAGALPAGFYVAAGALAVLSVGRTIVEWRRLGPGRAPAPPDAALDEEDAEEEAG